MKINVGWKPQLPWYRLAGHHFLRARSLPAYMWYRAKWHLGPRCYLAGEAPLNLLVEVSSLCNLRCIMCSDRFNTRPRGNMDMKFFERIIDEAAELRIPSIKLSYAGEPLMHPRFLDMLEMACSTGADVSFLTNGLQLTPDKAERAVAIGPAEIVFSIDGLSREVYERIRVGASYDRLMKNVEAVIAFRRKSGKRLPLIRVQFTRQRDNAHETESFVRHWEKRVDMVTVNEYARPLHGLGEDLSVGRIYSDHYRTTWSEEPCSCLWQRLAVLWNGDAVPCNGEYVVGNLMKDSGISRIWRGETLNALRRRHRARELRDIPHCSACGYRNLV